MMAIYSTYLICCRHIVIVTLFGCQFWRAFRLRFLDMWLFDFEFIELSIELLDHVLTTPPSIISIGGVLLTSHTGADSPYK